MPKYCIDLCAFFWIFPFKHRIVLMYVVEMTSYAISEERGNKSCNFDELKKR